MTADPGVVFALCAAVGAALGSALATWHMYKARRDARELERLAERVEVKSKFYAAFDNYTPARELTPDQKIEREAKYLAQVELQQFLVDSGLESAPEPVRPVEEHVGTAAWVESALPRWETGDRPALTADDVAKMPMTEYTLQWQQLAKAAVARKLL